MEIVDNIIVGAGIIGIAIAKALSAKQPNTLILEQNTRIGEGISSRNSEVIHAGIYYPKDSLKTKLCVRGNALLYDYCQTHNVPHKKTGKLIVATNQEQLQALEALKNQAAKNGALDLTWLNQEETHALEPEIRATASLLSPSSGILDAHQFMLSLLGDAQSNGANLALNTQVNSIEVETENSSNPVYTLKGLSNKETFCIKTHRLILAAGLSTQGLASCIEPYPKHLISDLFLVKGNYFSLSGSAPFKHLIYPLPDKNLSGLGIHATLDLSGAVRFGPDVELVENEDYSVDTNKREGFYKAIQAYWPSVNKDKLIPDYAGIRPKLSTPGGAFKDFCIQTSEAHQLNNLVVLMGIESPGLTASLAIAEHIERLINQQG